jgi:hypothetical protein
MHDFEKLGVFYLGRPYDLDKKTASETPLLYDSKDLTTHALCVGMTGSGKTGLCVALLEEAAIDGIPALIIDPKGDLGNLLLTFPGLKPEDFQPWLDPADATRKGLTLDELAKQTAKTWREGLAAWGQDGDRIRRYRDAVDIAIYTPGGTAGLPLTVLRSFSAPPPAVRDDNDAMRERVQAAVSGLLALVGVSGDPLRSREHILVATILDRAWREGADVDLGTLIRSIQQPSFDKVGFLDLESFYPAKERFELAMALNNLLASPGFQTWMTGDPLDIGKLLYTSEGKPRLTILSIAHLSDAERMFFVTIVLNEVIAWMRAQSGTSSLRALLYMDEVFGYFPPSAEPPSKRPMLTLLKQARAYGLGVVLATQNPVDLDYKGLSNCGTWLLGRLQTERDKNRVLDGLEGASTAAGATFDRARMETILSGLGNRVFLMNNVHDDAPVVFQSRWALSFLRGPLAREQVAQLMAERKRAAGGAAKGPAATPSSTASSPTASTAGAPAAAAPAPKPVSTAAARPVLPPDVPEMFIACGGVASAAGVAIVYRPAILGSGRVHYVSAKEVLDEWRDVHLLAAIDDDRLGGAEAVPAAMWDDADELSGGVPPAASGPQPGASFASLPGDMAQPKRYAAFSKALKEKLYRSQRFRVWRCAALKLTSRPSESEADFKTRVAQAGRERRDLEVEKLRAKYGPKLQTLQDQLRRAQQAKEKQQSQAKESTMSAVLQMGTSVLGAIFGRKLASVTNANRAAAAMKKASKIGAERQDVANAEENVQAVQKKLADMDAEFQAETTELQQKFDPAALEVEELAIQPRKTDIAIGRVTLCWTPWVTDGAGLPQKAW